MDPVTLIIYAAVLAIVVIAIVGISRRAGVQIPGEAFQIGGVIVVAILAVFLVKFLVAAV